MTKRGRQRHARQRLIEGIRRTLRTFMIGWACAVFVVPAGAGAQTRRLVLVADNNSAIPELSLKQVRQIFLGHALRGEAVTPLSNQTDDLLYEVFLQKVIFLSERDYEKRLITRTFQTGERRPVVHVKEHDLLQSLVRLPGSITYMWEDTAARYPELRVVKVLWSEQEN